MSVIRKYKNNEDISLLYYSFQNNQYSDFLVASLVVKIGSLGDPMGKSGLAHFLEHMNMNFDKYRTLEKEHSYNCCYAYTNYFETVYIVHALPFTLSQSLKILQDIISGKYLVENKLEEVRKDIITEWVRKNGSMQDEITKILYSGSVYKELVPIGAFDDINMISYKELHKFFLKWYQPENMQIQIVSNNNEKRYNGVIKENGFQETHFDREEKSYLQSSQDYIHFEKEMISTLCTGKVCEGVYKIYYNVLYDKMLQYRSVTELNCECLLNIISDVLSLYLKQHKQIEELRSVECVNLSRNMVIMHIELKVRESKNNIDYFIQNYMKDLEAWLNKNYKFLIKQYLNMSEDNRKVDTLEDIMEKMNLHFVFERPFLNLRDEQIILKELIGKLTVNELCDIILGLLKNSELKVICL